jgi:hypothetical protein
MNISDRVEGFRLQYTEIAGPDHAMNGMLPLAIEDLIMVGRTL